MGLSVLGAAFIVSPGIETAETAINLKSFSCRYFGEVDRATTNHKGETVGKVVSTVPSREINLKGEVMGSTGLMAATWIAGVTIANDTTVFGTAVGLIMLVDVTESQEASGNRSVDMNFRSDPLFLAVA